MDVWGRLKACLDYPFEVALETTGRCNARCDFCPHDEIERKNEYMSDEMFLRVIEQLKEIPQTHYFQITPHKVNEFLMDKKIFERIDMLLEALPSAYIRIFTNLHMADDEDIKRLCGVKRLSDLAISLNSLDKDEYKMIMGLDLDRTKRNIHKLLAYVRKNGLRMLTDKILISRVAQYNDGDSAFLRECEKEFAEYLDMLTIHVFPRENWIDYLPVETVIQDNQPCPRWAEFQICCTGEVAFCCRDGRPSYPIGNIMENTVLEIYNKPEYRRLREEAPLRSQITPCRFCSVVY
ncbi:MAG: radical SAM protein [Clostridiales bacterium]|jgi:MoaA/NifB/PqqE/SkfB family radical SAM enzyme|nr:radical SAM protein [Clostridiales bacterium]